MNRSERMKTSVKILWEPNIHIIKHIKGWHKKSDKSQNKNEKIKYMGYP